jgi:hypothetical protein
MRAIIGLEGAGRAFRSEMARLGIGHNPVQTFDSRITEINFVYNESTSQILMAYTPDQQQFLRNLLTIPDFATLGFVEAFSNPQVRDVFTEIFRIYAMALIFQINRFLGFKANADYLLESIADDYIVLYVQEAVMTDTLKYQ